MVVERLVCKRINLKNLLSIFLLSIFSFGNTLENATLLFKNQKYVAAISEYKNSLEAYPKQAQQIKYNLGQSYLAADSLEDALSIFHQAAEGNDNVLRGMALNEIGILQIRLSKSDEALNSFQKALIADPENENARYNYELLARRTQKEDKEKPKQEDNSPQDESNDGGAKSLTYWKDKMHFKKPPPTENGPSTEVTDTIPVEEAIRLLENMKNNEVKYLQQLRKSSSEKTKGDNTLQW
jgi:Ca-activated chloride channel homolog